MDRPKQAWHLYSRFTRNLTLADDADLDAYWGLDVQRALEPREAVNGSDRVPLINATASLSLASVNGTVNASSTPAQVANAGRRLQWAALGH